MADIPPSVIGSSIQAGYQQADVAKSRDAERADQARAARSGVKSIDDKGTTIETGDDDTAIFSDAEGAGGQGRHAEEEGGEAGFALWTARLIFTSVYVIFGAVAKNRSA